MNTDSGVFGALKVYITDLFCVELDHPVFLVALTLRPSQARELADTLCRKAQEAEIAKRQAAEEERMKNVPPVDRSAVQLTDGSEPTPDHRELKENGQQKGYVVLTPEERAKGFVRPVRDSYTHRACGCRTTMDRSIAETYARDPNFYGGTFCCGCGKHFPLVNHDGSRAFLWEDGTGVGE